MKRTPFLFFSVENREAHFPHRPEDGEAGQDRLKGKASIPGRRPHSAAEKQSLPTHTAYAEGGAAANAAVVQAMRESSKRVLYTVLHSRGMDGISANMKVVSVTPWWQATLNYAEYTLIALTALAAILLVLDIAGIGGKKKAGKKN